MTLWRNMKRLAAKQGTERNKRLWNKIKKLISNKNFNRYFDADYGIMNEKGVAITESTCSAKIGAKPCTYIG